MDMVSHTFVRHDTVAAKSKSERERERGREQGRERERRVCLVPSAEPVARKQIELKS